MESVLLPFLLNRKWNRYLLPAPIISTIPTNSNENCLSCAIMPAIPSHNTVKKDPIGFYVASLSYKTVVYKGQLTSLQVRHYFPDLSNKRIVSAFGLIHSRFATNTFPSWKLAQPFRYIAHNGEINTVQGNLNWLKTSEKGFESPYFTKEEMEMYCRIVTEGQSDSACLDNMIELLTLCGRSLPHVMMMLIPEAWDGNEQMDPVKKAFYEFHASLMEPWDGPASISFTDGKIIGATLDRNGLRPSRYCVTTDDRVIMASETGVFRLIRNDQGKRKTAARKNVCGGYGAGQDHQ